MRGTTVHPGRLGWPAAARCGCPSGPVRRGLQQVPWLVRPATARPPLDRRAARNDCTGPVKSGLRRVLSPRMRGVIHHKSDIHQCSGVKSRGFMIVRDRQAGEAAVSAAPFPGHRPRHCCRTSPWALLPAMYVQSASRSIRLQPRSGQRTSVLSPIYPSYATTAALSLAAVSEVTSQFAWQFAK